jgi:hypothetical protein
LNLLVDTLSHISDESDSLYLELFDSDMKATSFSLNDSTLVSQMLNLCSNLKPDEFSSIKVIVVKVEVPALHRADKDLVLEKIVAISGVDFSHLYDKNHHHHHHS